MAQSESGQTPTDPPITAELLEDWLHPLSHAELVAMVIRIGLTVPQASQTIMDLILHQQKRKIFVCRLSPDTTSSSLHQAFSQYGTVSEAVVIQDSRSKRSRGFGFVKFADTASAERALQSPFKFIDGWETESAPAMMSQEEKARRNALKQTASTPPGDAAVDAAGGSAIGAGADFDYVAAPSNHSAGHHASLPSSNLSPSASNSMPNNMPSTQYGGASHNYSHYQPPAHLQQRAPPRSAPQSQYASNAYNPGPPHQYSSHRPTSHGMPQHVSSHQSYSQPAPSFAQPSYYPPTVMQSWQTKPPQRRSFEADQQQQRAGMLHDDAHSWSNSYPAQSGSASHSGYGMHPSGNSFGCPPPISHEQSPYMLQQQPQQPQPTKDPLSGFTPEALLSLAQSLSKLQTSGNLEQ